MDRPSIKEAIMMDMWSNLTFSSQLLLGQMCACWFDRCPIALLDVLDLIVASSCVVQRLQTSIRQSNFAPRVFLFTICRATRTNIEKGISELTQSKFVFDKVDRRNPLFYSCSRICFQRPVLEICKIWIKKFNNNSTTELFSAKRHKVKHRKSWKLLN